MRRGGQKSFPNKTLEQYMFVKLARCMYDNHFRNEHIIKLQRRLCSFKDAASISSNLLLQTLTKFGFKELQSATCVILRADRMVVSYVDDSLI